MKKNNIEMVWNLIETAIKSGISGSKIADKLQGCGMSRMQALALVACIGGRLNMEAGMSFEDGFKAYAGI